ncbi:hypothetical protein [Jatrophihabitans sp.]|uniref:hypothetical protein n=1 Tax=Jatrophihabitans sp. TaxID=1932789 RepID=UPI0030C6EB17|nr:hypothetical protein [Jatrophihabitans sp.]
MVTASGTSAAKGKGVFEFAAAAPTVTGAGYVVASSVKSGSLRFTEPSFTCSTGATWQVAVRITTQRVLAVKADSWGASVTLGCKQGTRFSRSNLLSGGDSQSVSHPHAGDRLTLSFAAGTVEVDDESSNSGSGGGSSTSGVDANTPKIAYVVAWSGSVPGALAKLTLAAAAAGKPLAQSHPVAQSQILGKTSKLVPSALASNGKTFTVAKA